MFLRKKPRPNTKVRAASKAKSAGLSRVISVNSRRGKFITFVFIFAVIGGGYMVYRSFADTYPTKLIIYADSVPNVAFDASGPNPYDNTPHDVGTCGKKFTVTTRLICPGTRIGPVSITAGTVPGYTFVGWSGCDGTSPSGNSCWMRLYSGNHTKGISAQYKSSAPAPQLTTPNANGNRTEIANAKVYNWTNAKAKTATKYEVSLKACKTKISSSAGGLWKVDVYAFADKRFTRPWTLKMRGFDNNIEIESIEKLNAVIDTQTSVSKTWGDGRFNYALLSAKSFSPADRLDVELVPYYGQDTLSETIRFSGSSQININNITNC